MKYPCKSDPESWFDTNKGVRDLAAKACAGCPIIKECGDGALARKETWGVWGGVDFEGMRYSSKTRPPRVCEECGKAFVPRVKQSNAEAAKRRFCSRTCGNRWTHRDRMARRRVA